MANQYLYDLTDTWNNVATTFDAIKINVTDTNSAAGSKLLNLQVEASPKFTVQKDGAVALTGAVTGATSITGSGTFTADRLTVTKTTANAPAISSTGYSLTGSDTTAMIDLAGTWNTSGTPTAINLNITESSTPNTASLLFDLQRGGASQFAVRRDGAAIFGTDVFLLRDAANTLAQRNAGNAQTFNIYNTFSSSTSYERLSIIAQSAGAVQIVTNKGSAGGSARALELGTDGTTRVTLDTSGNVTMNTSGATLTVPQSGGWAISGRVTAKSGANGVLTLYNNAQTGFGRLQLGGTSASFPALAPSGAKIFARLADDSANAAFESASLRTDAPAGGTAATWKLGAVATVSPTSPDRTIEVDIGGTIYYIHAKTTNN